MPASGGATARPRASGSLRSCTTPSYTTTGVPAGTSTSLSVSMPSATQALAPSPMSPSAAACAPFITAGPTVGVASKTTGARGCLRGREGRALCTKVGLHLEGLGSVPQSSVVCIRQWRRALSQAAGSGETPIRVKPGQGGRAAQPVPPLGSHTSAAPRPFGRRHVIIASIDDRYASSSASAVAQGPGG